MQFGLLLVRAGQRRLRAGARPPRADGRSRADGHGRSVHAGRRRHRGGASSEPGASGALALAIVFLGISLSYVVGVPLGAWLGFRFGWQVPVAAVGAAALLMLRLSWPGVPLDDRGTRRELAAGCGRCWHEREVLWPLLLTLLYFIAIFCVFAYIGPVLHALLADVERAARRSR